MVWRPAGRWRYYARRKTGRSRAVAPRNGRPNGRPSIDDKKGFFHSLKSRLRPADNTASGLYFHGGVGRGKSFLMDGFYLHIPTEKKLRVHFHRFMLHFHEDMKRQKGQTDPLIAVADSLADKFSLICFDEFHVSDIADAVILGRLLERLLERGVKFVLTSNYVPDALYPNGFGARTIFADYRFIKSASACFCAGTPATITGCGIICNRARCFFHPLNEKTDTVMRNVFHSFACGIELPPQVKVGGRVIPAIARASSIVWFSLTNYAAALIPRRLLDFNRPFWHDYAFLSAVIRR